MKRIDIHTKKSLNDDEERYNNPINENAVEIYVRNNINFKLTDDYWSLINNSFSHYWNNILGIGGYIINEEIVEYIYKKIVDNKIIFGKEKVEKIVNLMLDKIEADGGFLND